MRCNKLLMPVYAEFMELPMENSTITGIPGLLAGHATDRENGTGCTVVLCPEGFTPGVALAVARTSLVLPPK